MEKLLHFAWKYRLFPLGELSTTEGTTVEVIDTGQHNFHQGPDFFNAKVRIGETLWVGNVEIHQKASDWYLHGHDQDAHYNNVVLHVVEQADCEVKTAEGKTVATLMMPIPQLVVDHYRELCQTDDFPRCHRLLPQLPKMKVNAWLDALLAERLAERARKVMERVEMLGGDWERATFVTLSRNFGFGLNGDAFERWAMLVPMSAAGKHRSNLPQLEALFLGVGGLLDALTSQRTDEEKAVLQREWRFLTAKFSIESIMTRDDWKFLRTRPQSMPHVRLLQLAHLYNEQTVRMSTLLETKNVDNLRTLLRQPGLSKKSADLLIVNTVVPLLYAYGQSRQMPELQERAIELLQAIPAEENYIMRQWKACSITVDTAADSQALIQLKRNYCDRRDCLRCRFAYEYLK